MNLMELRQDIADRAQAAGSAKKLAEATGVSHSHLSAIIRGDAKPEAKTLNALGIRRRLPDKKNKEVWYEDITN